MAASAEKDNKEKKKAKSVLGSVMFRAWLAFLVLALCVVAFFWTGEFVIFSTNYIKMYVGRLTEQSRVLEQKLKNNNYNAMADSFRSAANDCARDYGMTVVVFSFREGANTLNVSEAQFSFYADPTEINTPTISTIRAMAVVGTDFLVRMNEIEKSGSFVANRENGSVKTVIYGSKMIGNDGSPVYLYVSTSVNEYGFTVRVLTNQMLIVTIICIAFSLLISLLIAWHFARPIKQFTATARRIGDGDLSLEYKGNGYNEFDDLADALNYATSEMVKAENFRRDFLTNVSHDIRTPLTLIKANAEMIRDISGDKKEKRDRNTQTIINEADRLTLLVEDILDLSKLQAGVVEMKNEIVDVGAIAREVVSQFDVLRVRDGYVFETDIEQGLLVICDRKRLTQVVYNLVGNAINYVGDDRKVVVRVFGDNGKAKVEISDHGKGIPLDEIDKVWERYYRSNRQNRNVVGSGIGLSIVKNVLIGFNAEYGIISHEGEGTTFWFALPLDKSGEK